MIMFAASPTGYKVELNWPYEGGELNRRFGDPKNGIESLCVEVNKSLFMDTQTYKKTAGFDRTRRNFQKVLESLARSAMSPED